MSKILIKFSEYKTWQSHRQRRRRDTGNELVKLWCVISVARCNVYILGIVFSLLSCYHLGAFKIEGKQCVWLCFSVAKETGSMENCCSSFVNFVTLWCGLFYNLPTILFLCVCVSSFCSTHCYRACDILMYFLFNFPLCDSLITGSTVTAIIDTFFYSILFYCIRFYSSLVHRHSILCLWIVRAEN